jgi:deoxyribose-phosphate aldolase
MNLAPLIDHTLLRPDATAGSIETLCQEALEHGFHAVCVNPYWVATAKALLSSHSPKLCSVVGFPLGASLPQTKVRETADVIHAGADEIDMVMNIGAAIEGHWNFIEHEIHEIVSTAQGRIVKVILETAALSEEAIVQACKAAQHAGASFVKTSTGFGPGGATEHAVRLMRAHLPAKVGIKASGGISTREQAEKMVAAGANRLGASASVAIVLSA